MEVPPFKMTAEIIALSLEIAKLVGKMEGFGVKSAVPFLRKQNQVKTIQGSLAIEGNTLSLDQITSILEGKRIIGDPKEIKEVKNALLLYEQAHQFSYTSSSSFKQAHGLLMKGLIPDAGSLRSKNVGIIAAGHVKHVALKPGLVPNLIENLFLFLKKDPTPILIKSAVVHYEIEFIHPFADGNGRMGRFWQHLLLVHYHPLFKNIPFETVIKDQQQTYYQVLAQCDKSGDSTPFIHFSLQTIRSALMMVEEESILVPIDKKTRLEFAHKHFGNKVFSRKDYILSCKNISTATSSRDLKFGVEQGILTKTGDLSTSLYQFI